MVVLSDRSGLFLCLGEKMETKKQEQRFISDVNWRFVRWLFASHVIMWIYGFGLAVYFWKTHPEGVVQKVNAALSIIFLVVNMIGISGVFGKPVSGTSSESEFSWRSLGVALVFFISVGLFGWLAAKLDLTYLLLWSAK